MKHLHLYFTCVAMLVIVALVSYNVGVLREHQKDSSPARGVGVGVGGMLDFRQLYAEAKFDECVCQEDSDKSPFHNRNNCVRESLGWTFPPPTPACVNNAKRLLEMPKYKLALGDSAHPATQATIDYNNSIKHQTDSSPSARMSYADFQKLFAV